MSVLVSYFQTSSVDGSGIFERTFCSQVKTPFEPFRKAEPSFCCGTKAKEALLEYSSAVILENYKVGLSREKKPQTTKNQPPTKTGTPAPTVSLYFYPCLRWYHESPKYLHRTVFSSQQSSLNCFQSGNLEISLIQVARLHLP